MPIKFDHTRIRVGDMQRSIDFYQKLGFVANGEPRKSPAGNQIIHLELPGNEHRLELTYSPDYEMNVPEDLVHTCLCVDDVYDYLGKVEAAGIEVWPDGWREKFKEKRPMAFVTDPDNYEVEILAND